MKLIHVIIQPSYQTFHKSSVKRLISFRNKRKHKTHTYLTVPFI